MSDAILQVDRAERQKLRELRDAEKPGHPGDQNIQKLRDNIGDLPAADGRDKIAVISIYDLRYMGWYKSYGVVISYWVGLVLVI